MHAPVQVKIVIAWLAFDVVLIWLGVSCASVGVVHWAGGALIGVAVCWLYWARSGLRLPPYEAFDSDPIIFGKLIDEVATQRGSRPNDELVRTALLLLALAVGVALASRAARALQDYTVRRVVQRFGTQIFNDGLRQTMRLNFQEYEDARSGETLALLMRVRQDTERFINAFINVLFASLIGMSFLLWYAVTKTWLLVPVFLIGLVVLGGCRAC